MSTFYDGEIEDDTTFYETTSTSTIRSTSRSTSDWLTTFGNNESFHNCTIVDGKPTTFIFSESDSTAAWIIATFCAITGSVFNFVTILALLNHRPTRKHVTTPFVISLACSDFLFSAVTLPLLAVRFYARDWVIGEENEFVCQIFPLLFYGNTAATLLNILAVTINRWVMIYFPNHSEKVFTRVKSKIYIAFCWIVPILLVCPSLLKVWGQHGLEPHTQSCTIRNKDGKSPKMFLMTFGVVLPTIILFITNTMIYAKIMLIRKKMEYEMRESTASMPKGLKEREQRLTKMMLIIFTCFIISYMPSYFIKSVFDKNFCHPSFHVACYVINWLSVVMDPSIYVATQERYRLAIRLLWFRVRYMNTPEKYNSEFRRPSYHLSQIRSVSDRES